LVAMLSVVVFVCSFVPVLGVLISTTPIVLVALNAGGFSLALAAVGLVIVIHAIESYLLNPMIYGKHLKLNPVLTLIILYISYHAFGLWGMLLGVPVSRYIIHDVLGVPFRDRPQPARGRRATDPARVE
jgi:predicted PurR-regulated permease PerM